VAGRDCCLDQRNAPFWRGTALSLAPAEAPVPRCSNWQLRGGSPSLSQGRRTPDRSPAVSPPDTSISCRSLLHSQYEALEEPGPDENPIVVSIESAPREIVTQVLTALSMAEVALSPARPSVARG